MVHARNVTPITTSPKRKGRGPARFRKSEVTRATKAAAEAGLSVERLDVDPDSGRISVIVAKPNPARDDLDHWLEKRTK